MTKRRFSYGDGAGKVVPILRDSDDESKELAAAHRAADRLGERPEIMVQLPDGSWRNMGPVDWDDSWDPDDLWDYVDGWLDDMAYGGDGAIGVSVAWR